MSHRGNKIVLTINDAKVEADYAFNSSKIGPHIESPWRCFIGVSFEQHESVTDKTSEFFKLKFYVILTNCFFCFYFKCHTLKTNPIEKDIVSLVKTHED